MSERGEEEITKVRDILKREMSGYELVTDRRPGEGRGSGADSTLVGTLESPPIEHLKRHYANLAGRDEETNVVLEEAESDIPAVGVYLVKPEGQDVEPIAVVISLVGEGKVIGVQT